MRRGLAKPSSPLPRTVREILATSAHRQWVMAHKSGFTPWHRPAGPMILLAMNDNNWPVKVEVATCLLAAVIALTLMVGLMRLTTFGGRP